MESMRGSIVAPSHILYIYLYITIIKRANSLAGWLADDDGADDNDDERCAR